MLPKYSYLHIHSGTEPMSCVHHHSFGTQNKTSDTTLSLHITSTQLVEALKRVAEYHHVL